MLNITIGNLYNVNALADSHDYVISILDPKLRKKEFDSKKHITVYFDDTEFPSEKEFSETLTGINRILAFAQRWEIKDPKVLVHCHAGVSRSPAIAWLLMIYFGADPQDAFDNLFSRYPNIWPNTSVMSIGDSILNKDGNLYKLACKMNAKISIQRNGKDDENIGSGC